MQITRGFAKEMQRSSEGRGREEMQRSSELQRREEMQL